MTVTPDWLPGLPERNGVFLLRPLGPNTKVIHGMPAPDIPALFFEHAAGIRLCLMAGRNTPVTAVDLRVRFPQLQHVGPLVDVPMASKAAQKIVDDAMRPRIEAIRCELEQLKTQYATCKAERDEALAMAKKLNAAYEDVQAQLLQARQVEGAQRGTFTAQPEQFGPGRDLGCNVMGRDTDTPFFGARPLGRLGEAYVRGDRSGLPVPTALEKRNWLYGNWEVPGEPRSEFTITEEPDDETPPNSDDKDTMQP